MAGTSSSIAVESLLVPWFAFQNSSVLAAEALVECVVNLFRSGWTVHKVQMELSFLLLRRQDEGMQQVNGLDNDMLLSFVTLIMITCKEVGCPMFKQAHRPAEPPAGASADTRVQGLRQYARQTLQQYANGVTLHSMQSQQQVASVYMTKQVGTGGPASQGGVSPNMTYMQNLTRIVLLTIESLQQRGLVPQRPALVRNLRSRLGMADAPSPPNAGPPSARAQPTLYACHLDPLTRDELAGQRLLGPEPLTTLQLRWLAVTLLLSSMGAAMGWAVSWSVLVDTALLAYLAGATAQQLYDALSPQEFAQAGSMFRAAAGAAIQADAINAEAFARTLSTAFVTWALMGVPHRKSSECSGWAWATTADGAGSSAVTANALSEFVGRTLQRIDEEAEAASSVDVGDASSGPGASAASAAMPAALQTFQVDVHNSMDEEEMAERLEQLREQAIQERISKGYVMVKVADPSLAETSSALHYIMHQVGVVRLARQAVLTLQQQHAEQGTMPLPRSAITPP